MIKLGTSGYSFEDWRSVFYPENIEKGKMLDFYAKYFNCVEINSTYYRIPHPAVFARLNEKTSDDFEFIVKLHKSTTHERNDNWTGLKSVFESVKPLKENGKFFGWLSQFPYSFKNTENNRKYLFDLKEKSGEDAVFVEFRHDSWLKDAVYNMLENNGIGYCCVDEPGLPNLLPPQDVVTSGTGYVRFHGRNDITWWDASKGDRYDYDYSEEELNSWLERINKLKQKSSKTYLFFNNCHAGQAIKNAQLMAEMMKNQLNIDV